MFHFLEIKRQQKFVSFILDGVTYSFGIILDEIKLATGEKEDICNLLSGLNTGFMFSSGIKLSKNSFFSSP